MIEKPGQRNERLWESYFTEIGIKMSYDTDSCQDIEGSKKDLKKAEKLYK